jgi:hypothetical protein
MNEAISKLLAHASKDIGVEEHPRGSNRGPRVEAMLATTGLSGGYPWCAAAVATWGKETFGAAWPLPRTADCDVLLDYARRHGLIHRQPARGDIFLVLASETDAIHTGLVSGINSASSTISTIEGNSNNDGSRDGYGVFSRPSRRIQNLRFVRWADALAADTTPEGAAAGWQLYLNEKPLGTALIGADGAAYFSVRKLLAPLFGAPMVAEKTSWDGDALAVLWDGEPIPAPVWMREGEAWVPVRKFAAWQGLSVTADSAGQKIVLRRIK